jgi:hypothetical protein
MRLTRTAARWAFRGKSVVRGRRVHGEGFFGGASAVLRWCRGGFGEETFGGRRGCVLSEGKIGPGTARLRLGAGL